LKFINMDDNSVSVIIPFYNARDYLNEAVHSALQQPETGEVIIIDDNSPDGGLELCLLLAEEYTKVNFLRHPDGKNHGAGASRNLGIKNARFPYIAFLDADDYYLPGRFSCTREIFNKNIDADGVYEAIGTHFQDLESKQIFEQTKIPFVTTIIEPNISPDDLFLRLMKGGIRKFHLDGLTVKSEIFSLTGYFNEKLQFHQDIDLMNKISAKTRLFPGDITNPVAIRRVHNKNRITYHILDRRSNYLSMKEFWESFVDWSTKNLAGQQLRWVVRRYFSQLRSIDNIGDLRFSEFVRSRKNMFDLASKHPWVFFDPYCWRRTFPSRVIIDRIIKNV